MAGNDYSTIAMILGIIGAVLIILGALLVIVAAATISSAAATVRAYGAAYGADVAGAVSATLWISAIVGIISAAVVGLGSMMVRNPSKRVAGGVLMIVFSIVSIFSGGGFLIGMVLGIVGGVLGLVSKP